jgi:hypothetical protein
MEYLGAWETLIHEKKTEVENLVSDSQTRNIPRESQRQDLKVTNPSLGLVMFQTTWFSKIKRGMKLKVFRNDPCLQGPC